MFRNKEIGKLGEEIATQYLRNKGYKILDRNFMCRQGEIDIVAHTKKELVFVEVKTRTNLSYGRPSEAVTEIKQNHIEKAIKYYIYKHHLENEDIRFDIIEVYVYKEKYKINHIKQAM